MPWLLLCMCICEGVFTMCCGILIIRVRTCAGSSIRPLCIYSRGMVMCICIWMDLFVFII